MLTMLLAAFDLQQPFDARLHHIMSSINTTDTNAAIPTANSMNTFMRKIKPNTLTSMFCFTCRKKKSIHVNDNNILIGNDNNKVGRYQSKLIELFLIFFHKRVIPWKPNY